MDEPIKISYSQMMCFKCPFKWYRQYVLKEKSPEYPALKFGKAVHKQIENSLLKKLKFVSLDDLPYVKNKSKAEIENEISLAHHLADIGIKSLQTVEDFGISNIDDIEFTCEEEFNIDIGNGIVRGFIDLSFKNDNGEIIVIDWKTTSTPYNEHQIKTSKQLTCYAYAYYRIYGVIPDKLCYVILNKKTEQGMVYWDTRTEDDLKEIELELQDTIEGIKSGIIYKNENECFSGPNNEWKCQFYNDCWRTKPVIINTEERVTKFAKSN